MFMLLNLYQNQNQVCFYIPFTVNCCIEVYKKKIKRFYDLNQTLADGVLAESGGSRL